MTPILSADVPPDLGTPCNGISTPRVMVTLLGATPLDATYEAQQTAQQSERSRQ